LCIAIQNFDLVRLAAGGNSIGQQFSRRVQNEAVSLAERSECAGSRGDEADLDGVA